jgi:hypothetical protein
MNLKHTPTLQDEVLADVPQAHDRRAQRLRGTFRKAPQRAGSLWSYRRLGCQVAPPCFCCNCLLLQVLHPLA